MTCDQGRESAADVPINADASFYYPSPECYIEIVRFIKLEMQRSTMMDIFIDSDDLEDEMTSVIEQLDPDDPKALRTYAYEVATGDDPLGWLVWIIDPEGDQGYVILDDDGVVDESGAGKYALPDDWFED